MKDVYVILAFHAHELLWDLPEKLLSYLEEENPMKEALLDENYIKKRQREGRDIYSMCSRFGDSLDAPLCVEYTNELLVQVKDVMPETFAKLKEDYRRGRLYPLYGHAHHAHTVLLHEDELTQEILWNKQYLHNVMGVPYPKYSGLFPTEDSLSAEKLGGIEQANVDYVIFPHLEEGKVPFVVRGKGDYVYRPFLLAAPGRHILAFPRNFPISQEIWRPITRMKRDEVKSQGYMLGEFPVFNNEYLYDERESYPISFAEGVRIYRDVLLKELDQAPDRGVLVYVQDLELMDFGDLALEIMEKAWKEILADKREKYRVHFVTPDTYIDQVLGREGIAALPLLQFKEISWAPEIRLILRADGHYPPLGVTGVDGYDAGKTGLYRHPLVFWENGKYFCGIFDRLLDIFAVSTRVSLDMARLGDTEYDLSRESLDSQAVLYLRLMKRACNWGWRPTEGRQKRPCLKGYLLCQVLLQKIREYPPELVLKRDYIRMDSRLFVGISETLKVFLDGRVNYLKYGLESYEKEHGTKFPETNSLFYDIDKLKKKALEKAQALYEINRRGLKDIEGFLSSLQDYCQAVYMATDQIQRVWGQGPEAEYLVEKMYHFLYNLYPPLFPSMLDKIDAMSERDVEEYFEDALVSGARRR